MNNNCMKKKNHHAITFFLSEIQTGSSSTTVELARVIFSMNRRCSVFNFHEEHFSKKKRIFVMWAE